MTSPPLPICRDRLRSNQTVTQAEREIHFYTVPARVILAFMNDAELIAALKRRGLTNAVSVLLDVIGPLGVLGAQLLWIAQPTAGLFGGREIIAGIARTLEQPDGVERLRALLDEDA